MQNTTPLERHRVAPVDEHACRQQALLLNVLQHTRTSRAGFWPGASISATQSTSYGGKLLGAATGPAAAAAVTSPMQ
jgi:hypothetical protein